MYSKAVVKKKKKKNECPVFCRAIVSSTAQHNAHYTIHISRPTNKPGPFPLFPLPPPSATPRHEARGKTNKKTNYHFARPAPHKLSLSLSLSPPHLSFLLLDFLTKRQQAKRRRGEERRGEPPLFFLTRHRDAQTKNIQYVGCHEREEGAMQHCSSHRERERERERES